MGDLIIVCIAITIVLIFLVVVAGTWYYILGWTAFSYKTGDMPSWAPADNKSVIDLRFKDCVFTVMENGTGAVLETVRVEKVLNAMAAGFGTVNAKDPTAPAPAPPATLSLVRPLNAFSFTIPGFNDPATVTQSELGQPPWCATPPATCDVSSASCYCVSGVGVCSQCAPGRTVTLTGYYKSV